MKGTEQLRDQAFALAHRSRAACLLCQSNCGSHSSAGVEDNFYLKENSMVYVGEARVAQLTPVARASYRSGSSFFSSARDA
jgi:hypothetical protein